MRRGRLERWDRRSRTSWSSRGRRREWADVDEEGWRRLARELGQVVADAGGAWLTLPGLRGRRGRRVGGRRSAAPHLTAGDGRCTIIIDPVSDGRERFAEAMRAAAAGRARSTRRPSPACCTTPADVEPDLVLVLGPPTRLPPSLVWELAYGELVFLPVALPTSGADHLVEAVEDFQGRRRRFGGLDT